MLLRPENIYVEVEEPKPEKFGYKALLKSLQSAHGVDDRKIQYEVGKTYTKANQVQTPRVASGDGYHYYDTLENCLKTYAFSSDKYRYFKVQVLGNFTENSDGKGVTTSYTFSEEITNQVAEQEKDKKFNIDKINKLIDLNPFTIVTGSTALFLQGVQLKRFSEPSNDPDIDLIVPFFFNYLDALNMEGEMTSYDHHKGDELELQKKSYPKKKNDCSFSHFFTLGMTKVDFLVDPKARYTTTVYKGRKYRVGLPEDIWKAKIEYATQGSVKHKGDLYDLLGIAGKKKEVKNSENIPW